jgi:hypothetical protein
MRQHSVELLGPARDDVQHVLRAVAGAIDVRLERARHRQHLRREIEALHPHRLPPGGSAILQPIGQGPVFITDRGKPAHVLLSMDAYRRLLGSRGSIADLLCFPGVEELELPLIRHPEPARAAVLT